MDSLADWTWSSVASGSSEGEKEVGDTNRRLNVLRCDRDWAVEQALEMMLSL